LHVLYYYLEVKISPWVVSKFYLMELDTSPHLGGLPTDLLLPEPVLMLPELGGHPPILVAPLIGVNAEDIMGPVVNLLALGRQRPLQWLPKGEAEAAHLARW
jgi:hypothetical protein